MVAVLLPGVAALLGALAGKLAGDYHAAVGGGEVEEKRDEGACGRKRARDGGRGVPSMHGWGGGGELAQRNRGGGAGDAEGADDEGGKRGKDDAPLILCAPPPSQTQYATLLYSIINANNEYY